MMIVNKKKQNKNIEIESLKDAKKEGTRKEKATEEIEQSFECDSKSLDIVSSLNSGVTREELAEKYNYKSWKSIDMYMRRKGYTWDSDRKTYYPKPNLSKNQDMDEVISELPTNSKVRMIINYYKGDNPDPRSLADRMGFRSHLTMAQYLKDNGYLWSSEKRNYYKSSRLKVKNTDDPMLLADYYKEEVIEYIHCKDIECSTKSLGTDSQYLCEDSYNGSVIQKSNDNQSTLDGINIIESSDFENKSKFLATNTMSKINSLSVENVYINNVRHDIEYKGKDVNVDFELDNSDINHIEYGYDRYKNIIVQYEKYLPLLELLNKNKHILENILNGSEHNKNHTSIAEEITKKELEHSRSQLHSHHVPLSLLSLSEETLDKAKSFCEQNNITLDALIKKSISEYIKDVNF